MKTRSRLLLNAFLAAGALLLSVPRGAPCAVGDWAPIGPGGGDIRAGFAFSPAFASDHTVFTAAYGGGVYKSVDGGQHWAPSKTANTLIYAADLAISPDYANDHTVFVATWSEGSWRSTDGGASWTQLGGGLPAYYVYDIEPSPDYANDHAVFAATDSGFYRSGDHGDTWAPAVTGMPAVDPGVNPGDDDLYALAISPAFATDRTIFAGGNYAVFKSTDGGDHWTAAMNGITKACSSCTAARDVEISPDFATDHTLFVSVDQVGVYRSVDGADTWARADAAITGSLTGRFGLSPAYASDGTLFVTAWQGLWKTADGTTTWERVPEGFHGASTSSVGLSPAYVADRTVLVGTYQGVWRSTDGGATFTESNAGLNALAIGSLAVSPALATDGTIFAGTWAGLYRSADRGGSWEFREFAPGQGSGGLVALSPGFAADHTVFCNGNGLHRSRDGGDTWQRVVTDQFGYDSVVTLGVSPAFPADGILLAGTQTKGVFRSADGGDTWAPANTGIPYFYSTVYPTVNAFAFSPAFATDRTLFAGTSSDGVFVSTDGGDSWAAAGTGLEASGVNYAALAISPNWALDGTVFAGTSGGGVFRSVDGAATWQPFSAGLNDDAVLSLAVSPAYATDRTVFAGTTWDSLFASASTPYGTFSLNHGAAVTDNPVVEADNEIVGAAEMRFSVDGGAAWTAWEPYAAARQLTLSAANGTRTVLAEFRDAFGNLQALSDSIVLATLPTGSFAVNGGAAYTRSTAITANNALTGAAQMRFSTDGGATWTAWQAYAATRALTLTSSNGRRTVLGEFSDAYDNVLGLSDTIVLDTVGPLTLAPTRAAVVYRRTASLSYRVNDAQSPTARVTIRIRRLLGTLVLRTLALGQQQTNRALVARFLCTLPRGIYRFQVYATDLAGNAQRAPVGTNILTVR